MSLKKRMFRSQMTILFTALFSFMLIILAVLVLFEDAIERQLHSMGLFWEAAQAVELGAQMIPRNLLFTFVAAFLLVGLAAIGVLLFLASFFTRKMNRLVMEPVEQLVAGTQRIQSGNLEEEIQYQGEEEFEHVCQTFNAMQRTMREDREQQVKNERARTDMVTGISHDLRTPLTAIQGYIKGVLDGVANTAEKQNLYLQTAYEATEEMNVLLQKLFDFSRMESGQMLFHMVPVSLTEYVTAYLAQKEAALDAGEVRFVFQAPSFLPDIFLDVDQVRRILDNLLENSRKYAGVRPVQVTVTLEQAKDSVVLHWQDNGEGVPEDKLPRIFDRFYRCDESRKEKGSGIGLYMVRCIMEQHRGKVQAENAGGLKISLHFPAGTAEGEGKKSPASSDRQEEV